MYVHIKKKGRRKSSEKGRGYTDMHDELQMTSRTASIPLLNNYICACKHRAGYLSASAMT